jgi:hypothetical protein
VNLDPVLLEILVCPACKASLTVDRDHDELVCNGCGLIYPVRDDIPIMLVDEARRPQPPEQAEAAAGESPAEADGDSPAEGAVASTSGGSEAAGGSGASLAS